MENQEVQTQTQKEGNSELELKLSQRFVLPDAISIFENSLKLYKSKIKLFFVILSIPFLFYMATLFANVNNSPFLSFSSSVLFFLANMIATICIAFIVIKDEKIEGGIAGYFKKASPLFWQFIWVGILVAVSVIAGFVLLIIPGIYLSIILSLVLFTFIDEEKRGINALTRSWSYVRGYWFQVFGRYMFLFLIIVLVMIIIGILASLSGLNDFTMMTNFQHVKTPVFVEIINNFVGIFIFMPFNMIYTYFIYKSLKQAKLNEIKEEDEIKTKRNIKIILISALIVFILFSLFVFSMIGKFMSMMF